MILFLVFSDWYNPGDVVVTRRDGTRVEGVRLQETRDEIVVQVEQTSGDAGADLKLTIAKSDIETLQEADTWVVRIHHVRWYLAGLMGLAVALMAWRWFQRSEIHEWMRNTWDFAKLLVPLLFGGVSCL